jgi:hypothetical protein
MEAFAAADQACRHDNSKMETGLEKKIIPVLP